MSDNASSIFKQVFQMDDLEEGIRHVSPLIGTHIVENEITTKYDEDTGEPSKLAWLPWKKWSGQLWLGAFRDMPSMKEDSPFCIAALQRLAPGESLIIDDIVMMHVPAYRERGGTTPDHFLFLRSV